jgi:hypothetical protein
LRSAKVSKTLLPHHSAPRLGSVCAPLTPALLRGPTPQCLRSAIVVNGAPRSTSTARRPSSRPGSCGRTPIRSVGAKLARDNGGSVTWMLGLLASSRASSLPQVLRCTWILYLPKIQCGSERARDGGFTADEDVGWAGLIASKLAPTGFAVHMDFVSAKDPMWERACSR